MKTALALVALCLAVSSVHAREWADADGRTFRGLLVGATKTEATFEKYGAGRFTIPISRFAPDGQSYIQAWRAARGSAIVLNVTVFQAVNNGALVKGFEIRHGLATADVPKWNSILDQKTITEKKPVIGSKVYPLATDHVFIAGLDDVLDKMGFSYLVVWPAGFYEYKTAGNAARRIVKYTITPPMK